MTFFELARSLNIQGIPAYPTNGTRSSMVAPTQPCLDALCMECMAACRNLSNPVTLLKVSKADGALCGGDESSTGISMERCGSSGGGPSSRLELELELELELLACWSDCAGWHHLQQKWTIPRKRTTPITAPTAPTPSLAPELHVNP